MTTLYQTYWYGRYYTNKVSTILGKNKKPQIRGIIYKLRVCTPRKPNSARRPIAEVFLMCLSKKRLAHIHGQGHNLRKHCTTLLRGGGARDLPGVNFRCIRGVYDFLPQKNKKRRRSIYGVPMPFEKRKRPRRKIRDWLNKSN